MFGPFAEKALVVMSADQAAAMAGGDIQSARPARVVTAVERDLDLLRRRAPELADSALAASAVAMALEMEHPFNSATSKSMCQARLADALRELRELAPPEEEKDALDEIGARREQRRRGLPGTEDQVRA